MKTERLSLELLSPSSETWDCEAVAVAIYEGGVAQQGLSILGKGVTGEVERVLQSGWMQGKEGEVLVLPLAAKSSGPSRVVMVGLGKEKDLQVDSFRKIGAKMVRTASSHGIRTLACLMTMAPTHGMKAKRTLETLAEGALMGSYRFDVYKSKSAEKRPEERPLTRLGFVVADKKKASLKRQLQRVDHIIQGVTLARDLGNHPGNILTPAQLAKQAHTLAESYPIKTTVLDETALAKHKMNGILAVGQGSIHPPCLIVMEYLHGDKKPLLAVVGKAVTFDSGGISLKPGAKMEEMKFDMCGGAAVFGFMQAIAAMELPINVVGIVPAAENLPSGSAQRPGDILETAAGVSVEVINTDAEGRLILADALHHAQSFAPDMVVDLATLTGACVVALGHEASAILGYDKNFIRKLAKAGRHVGERLWPLPMFDAYQELIKSPVADIKNTGGRDAGTITAACFLSRFVDKKKPWAHLDIAGTAWDMSGTKPYQPKGATGMGVRTLVRFAEKELL